MKRILAIMLAAAAALAFAEQSPTLIPFQGRLTDQQGSAYTNGQYTLTFSVYDTAVGGVSGWSERHEKVGVVNGMVNVFLGSIQPITNGVDFSTTKYLGITIDADNLSITPDPEMVPRQMIIPAFWAKNSEKLQGQDWNIVFDNAGATNAASWQIGSGRIANGAVGIAQLANGAVTSNKLASGAVNGDALASNSVGAASIAPGAITLDRLATRAVSTNGVGAYGDIVFSPVLYPLESERTLANVGTWGVVTNSQVTLTTGGKPVFFNYYTTGGGFNVYNGNWYTGHLRVQRCQIAPVQSATNTVGYFRLYQNNSGVTMEIIPTLTGLDVVTSGTYRYWVEHSLVQDGGTASADPRSRLYGYWRLLAFEL